MALAPTALLVLGAQTGLVDSEDDEMVKEFADSVKDIYDFVVCVRRYRIPVFFLLREYWPGYQERVRTNINAHGEDGIHKPCQLAFDPVDGDYVVKVFRFDAFVSTPLESLLRSMGIKNLMFCGHDTERAIISTVVHAKALDYDCTVLEDLCSTLCHEAHESLVHYVLPLHSNVSDSGIMATTIAAHAVSPPVLLRLPQSKPSRSGRKMKLADGHALRKEALIRKAADFFNQQNGSAAISQGGSTMQTSQRSAMKASADEEDDCEHTPERDEEQPAIGYKLEDGEIVPSNTREETPLPDLAGVPSGSTQDVLLSTGTWAVQQQEKDEGQDDMCLEDTSDYTSEATTEDLLNLPMLTRTMSRPQIVDTLESPSVVSLSSSCADKDEDSTSTSILSTSTNSTPAREAFFEIPQSPRPASRRLPSAQDSILCQQIRAKEVAAEGLALLSTETRGESPSTSSEKRVYEQILAEWTPINHFDLDRESAASSSEDEGALDGPPTKRRRSPTRGEKGKQKAEVQEDAEVDNDIHEISTEMQCPGTYLASSLKERMRLGVLKSHVGLGEEETIMNQPLAEVNNNARQTPREYLAKARRGIGLPCPPTSNLGKTKTQSSRRPLPDIPLPEKPMPFPEKVERSRSVNEEPPSRLESLRQDNIEGPGSRQACIKVLQLATRRLCRGDETPSTEDVKMMMKGE